LWDPFRSFSTSSAEQAVVSCEWGLSHPEEELWGWGN
jgi:hypothetical protein